jgi:signal transduction histidine kinase
MAHAAPQGRPPPRSEATPAAPSGGAHASHPDLLTSIRRVAACAARPAERTALYHTIVQQASALASADAALALVEPNELLQVRCGLGALAWLEGEFLPGRASFVGEAVQARAPRDAVRLSSHPDAYPLEQELGAGPALAVPLLLADAAQGALLLLRPAGERPFTQEEAAEIATLADVAAALVAGTVAYDQRRGSRAAAAQAQKPAPQKVAVLPPAPAGLTAAELIRALRHEINNPLAVVRAHSQLLERDAAVQEAQPLLSSVQQIAEAARRLGELTARLAAAEVHPDHAYVTADGGLGVVPEPNGGD